MSRYTNHADSFHTMGEKLTHNQQFKIDKNTDDIVAEISMQLYSGQRAYMYRDMLVDWLKEIYPKKIEGKELSPKLEYLIRWKNHHEREEVRKQLIRDSYELKKNPNEYLEESCKRLSEEYNLEWPPVVPDNLKMSDVDNTLSAIMRKINAMLANSNSDNVTLRSLQRAFGSSYTSDELREHLARLSEFGEITTSENGNGSFIITLPEIDLPY